MTSIVMEVFYDHNLSALPPTSVLHNTLQHLLWFTHPSPTYAQTYFINSLPENYVPIYVWSNVHITSFSLMFCIPYSFTIYLKFNTSCANNILRRTNQYTYLRSRTYIYVLVPKGLTQISKSSLTHVLRYRHFIPNGLYNIKKRHIITSR